MLVLVVLLGKWRRQVGTTKSQPTNGGVAVVTVALCPQHKSSSQSPCKEWSIITYLMMEGEVISDWVPAPPIHRRAVQLFFWGGGGRFFLFYTCNLLFCDR